MKLKSWVNAVSIISTILTFASIIWLGFSAFPTIDDFPCSLGPRDHGTLTSIMGWYHSWTARYFSAFLWAICPLVYDWQWGYHLTPVFILLLHLIGNWGFLKLIENQAPMMEKTRWILSGTGVLIYVTAAPSLPQSFYYYNGVVCYQPANALTLLAIGCYIRFWKLDLKDVRTNILPFFLLGFFVVSIVGSNEASMMAISMISGAFWFFGLILNKKLSWIYSLFVLLNLVCVAVVIFSPATFNRMNLSGSNERSFSFVISSSTHYIGQQLVLWFKNPWFLIASVLFSLAIRFNQVRIRIQHFGLFISIGLLLFMLIHIPSFLGEGVVQGRTANALFYFFLLIWMAILSQIIWNRNATLGILVVGIVVLLIPSAPKIKNIPVLYSDIFSGTAASHKAEFEHRMALIRESKSDTVYVPRYVHHPKSSYLSDIREYGGSNYYDRFYARMYGKKWIDFIDNKPKDK